MTFRGAFNTRPSMPRKGRCSSCGKRGLGKIKLGRTWEPDVRYCQYCGDIHIVRSSDDKDNSLEGERHFLNRLAKIGGAQ